MATYYWNELGTDSSGYDCATSADLSTPAKHADSPIHTDWDKNDYLWLAVKASCSNCGKNPTTTDFTFEVKKDSGSWETLAASDVASPGDNAMNYDTEAMGYTEWFSLCDTSICANPTTNGHAIDNSDTITLSAGAANNKKEVWLALDFSGCAEGSTYYIGVYDTDGDLGTSGSPLQLDIAVTIASSAHNLVVQDAYHENVVTPATASFLLQVTPTVNDAYNVLEDEGPLALGVHLNVNDAYHVLEDEGPITVTPGIVPNNAYHELVDEGPLNLTVHLDVNDCYHENVVTPATASFLLVVTPTVADCEHTLIDEGPLTLTLGGIHNLVMDADNYHVHDCDAADYVSVTVFDPEIKTGDSTWAVNNMAGTTYHHHRYKLESAQLVRSGRYIRVEIKQVGSYGLDLNGMSIGRELSPDSPAFRETPTRITFNTGSSTLDLGANGGPVWSDWIEVNLDANENYLLHTDLQGNISPQWLGPASASNLPIGWEGRNWSGDETMVIGDTFPEGKQYLDYRKSALHYYTFAPGARQWATVGRIEIRGEIQLDEVTPHDLLVDDAHHAIDSDTITFADNYLWNFRGYTLNQQPSDWTPLFQDVTFYDYDVIESLNDCIGGRYLKMQGTSGVTIRGIAPDDLPIWRQREATEIIGWHFSDFDLLMRWQSDSNTNSAFLFALRSYDRNNDCNSGYMIVHSISENLVKFQPRYSAAWETAQTAAKTMSINTWYWTRVRASGQNFKIKVWADSVEEPAAWDLDETETDWNFEFGTIAPIVFQQCTVKLDYFEIGTADTLVAQAPLTTCVAQHALEDDGPITIEEKIWLTIQDAEHVLEDDGPLTITQKIIIAAANASHDLVDEGPLALGVHLVVNDCESANVVTPTNLDLTPVITVADCSHDLIDEGPLDLTPVITVADCDHDLVDEGPLSLTVHLTVNDCYHDNVVTPTNLTLTPVIVPADCSHDLIDTGPLALTVHLDVADCYHVLEDDGPITIETTGIVNLVLQDAEHIVSDPGPLTLTVHLAVADCTHDLIDEGPLAIGVHLVVADASSDNVVTPTHLDLTPVITVADCSHDLVDQGPLDLTVVITVADAFHTLEDDGPITITVGAIELVVADCEHTVSDPGPVALTQKHNLTVADCEHTLEDDGPITISIGVIDLVVEDCYHLHDAESPYLVVALVVADCYHIHAPPEVALTQTHILSLNSAFHAHEVTSPTLELIITVSDCYHEHFADSANLEVILNVADCYHEHLADNVALTQTHILTVASCEDALTSDNVAMIVPLTVNGLTHEVTSDNILLLQGHLLAVGGIYHVHVAETPALSQIHNLSDLDTYIVHIVDNVTIPTLEGDLDHLSVVSITTIRSFGKIVSQRTIVKAGQ